MLLIEYGTGRYTKKAIIGSFQQFMGEKGSWCGAWISMVTFFISCYYSVVLGWCFYYVVYCIANELPDNVEDSRAIFRDYAEESKWPLLTHAIALMVAGLSVIKGVKTIEKVNLFLVPILLAILLFTFIWSLTREYADYGIKYLFTPNWESFKEPRLWVDAISQNAFDTGAGMGIFIPYSSFMSVDNAIVKYGIFIPSLNNLIRFVLPVEAVAIIAWWAIDLIDGETGDGEKWYEFGRETFVMTILQWGSLMLLVILVNCVVYFYRHKEPALDKRPILDDVDTVMTDTKTPEKQGLSGLTESYKSIRL
ncbi:unnamed protein product [Mytilus edulis]|uniref:Uncharacterized protein n=1 Tax=Mytilus edulis TaxID=6550 RepID=A0A8S3RRJ0_MYTED|nr:unnamed protein product [Mytilus edulis]